MNKKQLAHAVAGRTGLSQVKALEVVNTIFDADNGIIPNTIMSGERVTIPGFGTFRRRQRKARRGTIPRTGQHIQIPGKPYLAFRIGRNLKMRLLGG